MVTPADPLTPPSPSGIAPSIPVVGGVSTAPSPGPEASWSGALESTLSQIPPRFLQQMLLGGAAFAAAVGVWAWVGRIEDVSLAQGELAPQGDVYRIQPTVAGEVTRLFFEEGDWVEQGDIIAEIDHRLVETEVERLEQALVDHRAKLTQVEALIQQNQSELSASQAVAQAQHSSQQALLDQEHIALTTQRQLLGQLQSDHAAQAARLERLSQLVDRGAVAADHLFQVEQVLRERERSITTTTGQIDRSQANISQLEAESQELRATAQQQALTISKDLQRLHLQKTELESQIRETQILIARSQTELSQNLLASPISGIIFSLELANIGEVIQPGQTIAEVGHPDDPLILKAQLPSHDAGLVETGMPVNIKLDAFPYQDYGTLAGTVISLSPDTKADETLGEVYEVDIQLEQTYVQHDGENISLRPGQTAAAEIIVQRRRIISLLLDPFRKLQRSNLSL